MYRKQYGMDKREWHKHIPIGKQRIYRQQNCKLQTNNTTFAKKYPYRPNSKLCRRTTKNKRTILPESPNNKHHPKHRRYYRTTIISLPTLLTINIYNLYSANSAINSDIQSLPKVAIILPVHVKLIQYYQQNPKDYFFDLSRSFNEPSKVHL